MLTSQPSDGEAAASTGASAAGGRRTQVTPGGETSPSPAPERAATPGGSTELRGIFHRQTAGDPDIPDLLRRTEADSDLARRIEAEIEAERARSLTEEQLCREIDRTVRLAIAAGETKPGMTA